MAINTALAVMSWAVVELMNENWLQQLEILLIRFSHLGIGVDIASLSMIELWTVYMHLSRLADS